jgi:hypothetical protein
MKKIVVLMYKMVPLRVTLPLNTSGHPIPSSTAIIFNKCEVCGVHLWLCVGNKIFPKGVGGF